MTTDHLDDDALSAAVDGVATIAEVAHLSSCSRCQARQATLAAVAHAVGAPVPRRSPEQVDQAVARALAAWSPGESREVLSPAGIVGTPAPGSAPPTGRRQYAPPGPRHGRGSPRWLPAAAGIAAAVVIVGGAVALTRGRSPKRSTTAALAPSSTVAAAAPNAASDAAPNAAPSVDLGDQSDPNVLARLVDGAISRATAASAAATAGAPVSSAASSVAPATAQDLVPAPPACSNQARDALRLAPAPSANITVRYVASVRWLGQPAVVVVFSRPGGVSGAVMKTVDCSVLAILPL